MKAFLTGSRRYGIPKENSDIDLVVFMDPEEAKKLLVLVGRDLRNENSAASPKGFSVRFGNLNLLIETDIGHYQDWVDGTAELVAASPVSRETAVAVFDKFRNARKAVEIGKKER